MITNKICSTCKQEKPITEYFSNGYQPNGAKKYKAKCKSCQRSSDKNRLRDIVTNHFGSYCCKICGYSKCIEAVEFHHLNPDKKEWKLAELRTHKKETIFNELNKGILVCANCHREIHYGMHPEYLI